MKQKYKRFSSIFMYCVCVLAVVAIAVGTGYSLAFFSHSVTTEPQTLSFGTIKINEGVNTANINLGAVVPGETKDATNCTVKDLSGNSVNNRLVSFKTTQESLSCYLRASVKIEIKDKKDADLTASEKAFINYLTIGTTDDAMVKLTLGTNVGTWVYDNDGYFYLMQKNATTTLQALATGQEVYFITEIKFSSDIKNEFTSNGTTYTDVQSGLTFRFNIVCQAIQTAHVSSTLTDEVKNIFNNIV